MKAMMKRVVCHKASILASGFLSSTKPCTSVDVSCAVDGTPVTQPKALVHPTRWLSGFCNVLGANSDTQWY